jgi:hypothetical protein
MVSARNLFFEIRACVATNAVSATTKCVAVFGGPVIGEFVMSGQVPRVSEVVGTDGLVRMSPQAMEHLRAAIKEKDSLLTCREDEGLSHLVRLLEQLGAVQESMSSTS